MKQIKLNEQIIEDLEKIIEETLDEELRRKLTKILNQINEMKMSFFRKDEDPSK